MKIVVLAGGISTERDVSLISGKNIYYTLKRNGHKVVLADVYCGIKVEKDSIFEIDNIFDKDIDWAKSINEISEATPDINKVINKKENNSLYFGENILKLCTQADIVFIALHGENGENGKLQAAFDLLGIKYTGTDYFGAALAMNKGLTKEILLHNGIKTPRYYKYNDKNKISNMQFPRVIKVASGGSSIGVYIAHNEIELNQAIENALKIDNEILIEEYIKGREFSVGLIDGQALPVIEIIPKSEFYDYKTKYQTGNSVDICPANISAEKARQMQDIAQKVFTALRLKIYARVDFILSAINDEIYCLEANTLPGMTPMSLIPQEALAVGIDYYNLCERIIQLSLVR